MPEYLTHTREMYIGHLVTYKYVLYGQKKAELGKIVWHFQSMIFLQFFFACKFFTNIGKLYLKRKDFSCSFQIWSQNWNICYSKKVIKENANICDFLCVRNHFKCARLGPKLWLWSKNDMRPKKSKFSLCILIAIVCGDPMINKDFMG